MVLSWTTRHAGRTCHAILAHRPAVSSNANEAVLSDARPKWLQISAILRNDIELMAGNGQTRLPPESELTGRFGVSLMTLRQALSCLEQEGLIERRRRLGTFLTEQARQPRRIQMLGQIDDVFTQQRSAKTRLLSTQKVERPAHLAPLFPDYPELVRLVRARDLDGMTCSLAVNHMRPDVAQALDPALLGKLPVSEIIQCHTGFAIKTMEQELSAQLADPETANQLGIEPLDPVMVIIGTSFDSEGAALDVARLTYRADQFSFVSRVRA